MTSAFNKIAVGTAQFATNLSHVPARARPVTDELEATLKLAVQSGLRTLDTAAAYGEVEANIGRLARAHINFG